MNFSISIPKKIAVCLGIVVIVIVILYFTNFLDNSKINSLLRESYEEDDELDIDDLEKYEDIPELDDLEEFEEIPELDEELFGDDEDDINPDSALE